MSAESPPTELAPRPRPPRSARYRRSWIERIVVASGVTATVMAMMAAGVLAWGLDKYEAIPRIPFTEGSVEQVAAPGEPSNWLLVGTDTRDGIDESDPNAEKFLGDGPIGGTRTDTMIIARVDPETRSVDLLSIPRDLYVPIAGTGGESRINTAFNGENGAQRLVDTIESYFGIEINHYAEINFVGFQDVVDTLGGVPIWFDRPMRDTGSGLDVSSAGCHSLDGSQALAFARGRNLEYFDNGKWRLDGTGDLGRTSRQQYFLSRVAAVAASELDITSIGTINSILDVGGENLALDQAVSADDLLQLASIFSSVEEGQIRGHALPVYDFRAPNNAAVLGLVEEEAMPILNLFRGIEPQLESDGTPVPTTASSAFEMRVLNGSRIAGQAGEITSELGTRGFIVSSKDNAETTSQTKILYGPGLEAAAESVAVHLVVAPVFELDPTITDVALVTGTDFDGLLETPLPAGSIAAPTTTAPPTTAAPVTEAPTPEVIGIVPGPSPEGTPCA